ncbi:MbtH family protein [Andreprevotia chitinilytica]|uniref:MbtH family protein n=1 Tax=Andreprevotia chitinilytica TaxID=396808 RepID=UPI000555E40D|nr:MbtH family NRPS accessory protein [Andreprevotia chitinilytica]
MTDENTQNDALYHVVVNDEGQYSIWPEGKAVPLGWHIEGNPGTKETCLAYIKEVWTDMRPLSLRKQMESAGQ